jgi:hypothetical protein
MAVQYMNFSEPIGTDMGLIWSKAILWLKSWWCLWWKKWGKINFSSWTGKNGENRYIFSTL